MLWQVQNLGVVSECFEVLFWFAIFELAHLSLRETQPTTQKLLIERLAEKLTMTRMVAVPVTSGEL